MTEKKLIELAKQLGDACLQHNAVLTTAESCTGGGISMTITEVAGSSQWFDRAFITYSNDSKIELVGVNNETLAQYGAVSEAVVEEMAKGALVRSNANYAVAVSGIAGPDGGSEQKPVGTVCFAWAIKDDVNQSHKVQVETVKFTGDRTAVREKTIEHSLAELYKIILKSKY